MTPEEMRQKRLNELRNLDEFLNARKHSRLENFLDKYKPKPHST